MDSAAQPSGLARWQGKVALVTGASSGIGEAIARALGAAGLRVAVAARRTERLAGLQAELEAGGVDVLPLEADLAAPDGPADLFRRLREAWGSVDVLVNNAGLGAYQPFTDDIAPWHDILDVNVRALVLCCREALRDLDGRPEGAVVNISSLSATRLPTSGKFSLYTASKHAVGAFTAGLRNEVAQAGRTVKVGTISPGVVGTAFFDRAATAGEKPEHPYRVLDPADVADAVVYMLGTPPHVQVNDIVLRPIHQPN